MITLVQQNLIWTKVVQLHASYLTYNTLLNFLSQLLSYSIFSTFVDGPFPHPSSHHSPHHSYSPLLTPFPIISSHHSPSPLLRPLQLTTPQTTPPPLPHTTQNSSLLPHTAPLSVAETRNNVAVMILFLIYSPD